MKSETQNDIESEKEDGELSSEESGQIKESEDSSDEKDAALKEKFSKVDKLIGAAHPAEKQSQSSSGYSSSSDYSSSSGDSFSSSQSGKRSRGL